MGAMSSQSFHIGRRHFFERVALGVGLTANWSGLSARTPSAHMQAQATLNDSRIIVFQGDSVTDSSRNREQQGFNDPAGLGGGYAGMAVGQLLGQMPENHWECYNRGVSGHKVFQLADRWQADCLALRPDVLSILIGVNDFWHTLSHGYDGTVATYEQDYRALLDRTRVDLPDVILIIGEPFAVTGGTALSEAWYPAYAAYREAAKRIAEDYGATWIAYQSIFDEALMRAPVEHWCPDGVHPAPAGNYLMAQAWLDAFHTAVSA